MADDFHGLSRDLAEHLLSKGITALSPIQRATLPDLLAGRDVCAAAPTGSGKTLAFSAPLVERVGRGAPGRPAALVLSPTRELAVQIQQVIADLGSVRGIRSCAVYGGVKQNAQVQQLRRGVDVLVACPGRLEDLMSQRHVRLDDVRIVVIDEADRMADMGFLPVVRRLLDRTSADRQTVLVSATLDKQSDALARSHMHDPARHRVEPEAATTGVTTHLFWDVDRDARTEVCAEVIRRSGRTIVFSRTKHGADRIVKRLDRMGVRAAAIHGGRSQSQRDRSLQAFHDGSVTALVATDVAARGIHVDDVACVVHFDLPPAPADYQHRSGRTARAGANGTVVAMVTADDRALARQLQREHDLPFGVTPIDYEQLGRSVAEAGAHAGARPRPTSLGRDTSAAPARAAANGAAAGGADDRAVRSASRRGGPRGAAPRGRSSRRTPAAAPGPARQPRRARQPR